MRVFITRELLQAPALETVRLPRLLDFAVEGRHDVLVEPMARDLWTAWLARQDQDYARIWERAEMDSQQRQSTNPSDLEVKVIVGTSQWEEDAMELTLADSIDLLRRPLEILVEDETSDGLFLSKVMPSPLRPKWDSLVKLGSIRVLTLGGVTQVSRRLEERKNQDPSALRRSFMLIDSDAPMRWDRPRKLSSDVRKARACALQHKVRFYILARRMAENYIPPSVLMAWVCLSSKVDEQKREHVEAFSRLATDRQHYHHLKDGLKRVEVAYYGAVSMEDQAKLSHALGRATFEAFSLAKEADLRAYGVYDELTPVFQELIRLA